jgi:hypothetical protein
MPDTDRVRYLADNDRDCDYTIGSADHAFGCHKRELVVEKNAPPARNLATTLASAPDDNVA